MDGLSHKQRRFIEEYLLDANATQAAIRAGYSARSAQVTSSRLLDDPLILQALEEAQSLRSERTGVDADYLLKRLHEEIEADIADLYDEQTGDLLPLHEWPPVWRRGLVGGVEIEVERDGEGNEIGKVKKLKLSDRVRRIEALGRHVSVNAFRENIRVEGLSELAERLRRAALVTLPVVAAIDARSEPTGPAEGEPEADEATELPAKTNEPPTLEIPGSAAIIGATPAAYEPLLPPIQERQAFAQVDYENFAGGLLSDRD